MQPQDILATARAAILSESASVAALVDQLDGHFVAVAQSLFACQGHVLVAGSGTSNPVGARLAHLLSCCGTPALFIHPGDSQHGLSGAVTDRDVLILISKGGETTEVNYLARIARQRGATLVAFTEKPESTLGKLSHHVLRIQADPATDPYGMIATGSSLTVCAMADALCVAMLHLRGYTKESFAQTHPGGAVGLQLAAEKKDDQA
ncbi:MAG: SIS domain-containing protein [Chloroflexi bacterium]|nr:SIS domain-containing protein [Chloroflexota bacterium]